MGAIGGPGQNQRGHVGAGHQQQQNPGAQQQQEGRAGIADQLVAERGGVGVLGLVPGGGIVVFLAQCGGKAVHLGLHRGIIETGLGPRDEGEPAPAAIHALGRIEGERAPEPVLGAREEKAALHDPDDGMRGAVEDDPFVDDGGIAAQLLLPEPVAQHHDRLGAGAVFPPGKGATHHRTGADGLEQIGRGEAAQENGALGVGAERGAGGDVGREPGEHRARHPILEVIEFRAPPAGREIEDPEGALVGDGKRAEQHRASHPGQTDRGAEPQGQGQDAKEGEGGPAAELAEGVTEVGQEVADHGDSPVVAGSFAARLLSPRYRSSRLACCSAS